MPEVTNWKACPVFITSTDMHADRDHLRTFAVPVLEERLRERFHGLDVTELWGGESYEKNTVDGRRVVNYGG